MPIVVYYTNGIDGPMLGSATPGPGISSTIYTLEYLNEGGANIIFKILPTPNVLHNSTGQALASIHGKLLRLRKDFFYTAATKDQYQAYNLSFAPLFPRDNLLNINLVRLSSDLPELINDSLSLLPGRPLHRQNDLVPVEETFGLLITDMRPTGNDRLFQLKPKWLAQSLNAPQAAKRCRTCALRAQRAARQICTATDAQGSCPLKLVSKDIEIRRKAAEAVTNDKQMQLFLTYDAQFLLHTMRDYQQQFDTYGVLDVAEDKGEAMIDLCKAMTLRDCTLFLRRSEKGDKVEARLADLDMKHPKRLGKWRQVECGLINSGWYTNTEDSEVWQEEKICSLAGLHVESSNGMKE